MPATAILLELIAYKPGMVVPAGKAALDGPNNRIVLCQDDVAALVNGGTLQITILTVFARATATNIAIANAFATSERGASDGIQTLLIKRDDLDTVSDCQLAAEAELALRTQPQITLNFQVRSPYDGWDAGQTIRFINSAENINILLDIQSVEETLEFTLAGEYDEYLYNVSAAPYIVDTAG